jgi:hypothetical protein
MVTPDRAPGVRLVTDRPERRRPGGAFAGALPSLDAYIKLLEQERPVKWIEDLGLDPALAELEGNNGVGLEQVLAAEQRLA